MINKILALAAKLPTGLNDPKAADKLLTERAELIEALDNGDFIGALTEAADAAYYAAKHLDYVANLVGLTPHQVMILAIVKYSLRAHPGNVKDDEAERAAIKKWYHDRLKANEIS